MPHPCQGDSSRPSSTRSAFHSSRRILATSVLLVSSLLVLTSGVAPGTSAWLHLGAPSIAHAASNDNNGEWDGLYSDQSALYMNPTQPGSGNAVTVKLRTFTGDITSANVTYYDTACSCYNWAGMSWASHDVTGTFDIWQATIPAIRAMGLSGVSWPIAQAARLRLRWRPCGLCRPERVTGRRPHLSGRRRRVPCPCPSPGRRQTRHTRSEFDV